ncbi:MAG: DNA gyrase C-terminal beta-propeller domain-containing protein, partial [Thermodesulfobacteriaceae bacterium]|nr:DNA gyrase C-terminal beta-propeller domain-containing protein [Thermodesulfobacteriaceae bacterium]
VIGIRLEEKDEIISLIKVEEEGFIFTITERGYGKKTAISEFRIQGRGGKGILAHKLNEKTGFLVDGILIKKEEEIFIFASTGKVIRISEKEIPQQGRNTKGVRLISLLPGERVLGINKLKT